MTHRHSIPPRLAERLLAMALGGGEWSETILGDLHEEHAARAGSSRSRAAFWYCRQACRLGATGIAARIRTQPRLSRQTRSSLVATSAGRRLSHANPRPRIAVRLRSILKRPAMSAIVVLTLALGLGANAAIFSMFDALVLRPFTMPDVDRITLVTFTKPTDDNRREAISPADYLDLRRQRRRVRAPRRIRMVDGQPRGPGRAGERAGILRQRPTSSRRSASSPSRDAPSCRKKRRSGGIGASCSATDLWQRRFASDPSIVGQSVHVDGELV